MPLNGEGEQLTLPNTVYLLTIGNHNLILLVFSHRKAELGDYGLINKIMSTVTIYQHHYILVFQLGKDAYSLGMFCSSNCMKRYLRYGVMGFLFLLNVVDILTVQMG